MGLLQPGDQRVIRVEFQCPLADRNVLPGGAVDAGQRRGHAEGVGDQAGRRFGQAGGQPDFLDVFAERLRQPGQQIGEILLLLFALGLVRRLLFLGVEVDVAHGHRLQRFAVELGHRSHPDLVDRVGEQQHLVALGFECLEVRGAEDLLRRFAGGVEDLPLALFHPLDVGGQRGELVLAVRRGERGDLQQRLLVVEVAHQAFFEDLAELTPEGAVVVRPLGLQILDRREDLLGQPAPDRVDLPILLQDLARDVERQILCVDDTLDEAQVSGHQLVAVAHDEDAFDVQLHTDGRVAVRTGRTGRATE